MHIWKTKVKINSRTSKILILLCLMCGLSLKLSQRGYAFGVIISRLVLQMGGIGPLWFQNYYKVGEVRREN